MIHISIAIDDYDLLDEHPDNMSRQLLMQLWPQCKKIKLDYKLTRKLINGNEVVHEAVLDLLDRYPEIQITIEGVQEGEYLTQIHGLVHRVQISSKFGELDE